MTFWTNIYDRLSAEFKANFRDVNLTGVILSKSDGSPDLQQSGGNGDALVSLSTASTAALASQTTAAALLAVESQPEVWTAITPHDTNDLSAIASKGLKIGGSGNLVFVMAGSTNVITQPVQPGEFFPGHFKLIKAATTATNVLAGS